jgi:5-(carboxyamino)imidazole ribonucleotide synthase
VTATTPRVGIIGGGQLARMTHQAAIGLGVDVTVLCPSADEPAVLAGAHHIPGRAQRFEDLCQLAEAVDVVTVDHEETPAALLDRLAELGHRVAPGADAARLGQDKAQAREVLSREGVPVAPWVRTDDLGAIDEFGARNGWPLVLKRPTGGYDGRGVWVVDDLDAAAEVLGEAHATGTDLLVEALVPFEHELAVMVVRAPSGEVVAYPPAETVQRDGQCAEVFTPASVPMSVANHARQLAVSIAHAVDLVGAMAVELFVTGDQLLLNELAVRPHNSGHLTIEACATSQFENHLRAVLDLPLGATDLLVPAAAMVNVLGGTGGTDPFTNIAQALAVPGVAVHRYAKEARPNRKIGHLTATGTTAEEARALAARAADAMAAPDPSERRVSASPLVGVIMGSASDLPTMQAAADALAELEVPYELRVVSAHRTPLDMVAYATEAADRGLRAIIAGAGGAAHLPGMVASLTTLPVIGVPVPLRQLDGLDSLLSIVQMPAGVPVATVGVGNARNAGLLAARILATADPALTERLTAEAEANAAHARDQDASL